VEVVRFSGAWWCLACFMEAVPAAILAVMERVARFGGVRTQKHSNPVVDV
jgi:hypothetical protein